MKLVELLRWYNLVFLLPFIGSLFLMTIQMLLGIGNDADVSTGDGEIGHDVDIGHDVSMDHDADISHDVSADTDHHIDVSGVHGHDWDLENTLLKGLGLLGFGKAPLAVIGTAFCLVWGIVGLSANQALAPVLKFPALYF